MLLLKGSPKRPLEILQKFSKFAELETTETVNSNERFSIQGPLAPASGIARFRVVFIG